MKPTGFTDWAERRAREQGSWGNLGRSFLATFWVMFGGPVLWLLLSPIAGKGDDAALYALLLALVGSLTGYKVTLFLFRRWNRR